MVTNYPISTEQLIIRPARTSDVTTINRIVNPLSEDNVLIAKDLVSYYESIQEFTVAETTKGDIAGFGAIHVMWEHLAEVRTLATAQHWQGQGVGGLVLSKLLDRAEELGVSQVFCLTFETSFFAGHGFEVMDDQTTVDPEIYAELLRSPDQGVAEFLDLARVKPNTLGNTRMILDLDRRKK